MKKLFTLLLVIVMMASLSVTVFAADNTINYSASSQTSGLEVSYNVQPNFTVTIPSSVSLGEYVTVSTDKVVVEYGKAVKVNLTGTSEDDDTFKVRTAEGAVLSYSVKKGNEEVNINDTVLTVTPTSNDTDVELTFVAPDNITYAGTYTGTVTFTIVVE